MTGTALRERVSREAPDLAVVFMTSFAGAAKERYGLRPGIDSVVEKPFEAAELLAAVEEALTIQEEGI
jgi:FixJ family two-component response regulator